MILSLYSESRISTLSLIFYTCICVPFIQITKAAVRIMGFLLDPHHCHQQEAEDSGPDQWEVDVGDSICEADSDEACAVCLTEFVKEERVSVVRRCGHVYHKGCLEKWLDRCQFTCPLCRSSLLRSSSCKTSAALRG